MSDLPATASIDRTTAADYRSMAVAKQESVKWLAATIAGAGLTLSLVAPVARIPDLDGYEGWAILGMLLGLAGLAVGIGAVFHVVLPIPADLAVAASKVAAANLRVRELAPGVFDTVGTTGELPATQTILDAERPPQPDEDQALSNRIAMLDAVTGRLREVAVRRDPVRQDAARRLSAKFEDAREQAQAWLFHQTVDDRAKAARIWMVVGVVAVFVGAAVALIAATRADERAERRTAIAAPLSTPVPVMTRLDPEEIQFLGDELKVDGMMPGGCTLPAVGSEIKALAVGGSYHRPVLLVALPGCHDALVLSKDPVSPPDPVSPTASAVDVHLGAGDLAALHVAYDAAGSPPDSSCRPEAGVVVRATLLGGSLPRPTHLLIDGRYDGGRWLCPPVALEANDLATVAQPAPPDTVG